MAEAATLSLAEELSKGFDDEPGTVDSAGAADTGGAGGDVVADVADAQPDLESDAEGRQRGPDGKFLKADDKPDTVGQPAAGDPAKPEDQAQETQGSNVIDLAPSTFTVQGKAAYNSLPKDSPLRAEIKKREADYQSGIEKYRKDADTGRSLMSEIQPYMAIINAEGGTPQAAIKSLLNTAYLLRTGSPQEKGQLVMRIAQEYGADISQFMGARTTEQPQGFDPQAVAPVVNQLLQPHLQRFEQFQNQLLTAQQRQEQEASQAANAEVETFRTAVAANGQPEHPYFDDVRDWMAGFIQSGHARTIKDAYDMACRAHPEVSKVIASEQMRSQEAQRLAEAKRRAEEARRASTLNASGQGGAGISGSETRTLSDELAEAYDRSVGAARV